MTEAAASLVIAPVIVALCFAENFRDSGSALWMDLNLETSGLFRFQVSTLCEPNFTQLAAERSYFLRKRAPRIRGVATGMETTKILVQLAFSGANPCFILDHQRSIYCDHAGAAPSLRLDPADHLVSTFYPCDVS